MATVLITGSTSGIGLGIAEQFAKAGYNVVFNGLEDNGAEIAANVAKEHGVQTMFSDANMLDPKQIKQMIDEAKQKFGTIDVLIIMLVFSMLRLSMNFLLQNGMLLSESI